MTDAWRLFAIVFNNQTLPQRLLLYRLGLHASSLQTTKSMFSSVICRAARAHAPLPTASYITGVPSTASITASSRQFTSRGHRRRYSSSKPSSPPDDSTKVAAQQQTPATTTSRTRAESDKRSVTRLSKRKAKDALVEAPTTVKGSKDETSVNINLPSVPSTHHLHPAGI